MLRDSELALEIIKEKYKKIINIRDLNLSLDSIEEAKVLNVLDAFQEHGIGSCLFIEQCPFTDLLQVEVKGKKYRPFDAILEDIICNQIGKEEFKRLLEKENIKYVNDDDVMDFLINKTPIEILSMVLQKDLFKKSKE